MVYTITIDKDRILTVRKSVGKTTTAAKPAAITKPATPKQIPAAQKIVKAAVVAASAKVAKPKKVKMIRDSFTMPSFDYALIAALKLKALGSKTVLKKSELLRAGLHALAKLEAKQLVALVATLAVVKTGRPKK